MRQAHAEILREYGPFEGAEKVAGITYDGARVWFASGDRLNAFDPESGEVVGTIDVAAHAGTTFDGTHLFQIAEAVIQKIDPRTGQVVATIPSPSGGASGMAWAEGSLWVGEYRSKQIHQVDPATGKVLRTITSDRFVTGVTWADGDLWHATLEDGQSELRRIDPLSGEVLEKLEMPAGAGISGLESDGGDRFFAGSASGNTVRAIRRPRRRAGAA